MPPAVPDRIAEIRDVVARLAEVCDLLALHAAVEAARAGEAGRPMAAVAQGVRALAAQSAQAARAIEASTREAGGARPAARADAAAAALDAVLSQARLVASLLAQVDADAGPDGRGHPLLREASWLPQAVASLRELRDWLDRRDPSRTPPVRA
jgi:methyl-accepting chemotaxis protein